MTNSAKDARFHGRNGDAERLCDLGTGPLLHQRQAGGYLEFQGQFAKGMADGSFQVTVREGGRPGRLAGKRIRELPGTPLQKIESDMARDTTGPGAKPLAWVEASMRPPDTPERLDCGVFGEWAIVQNAYDPAEDFRLVVREQCLESFLIARGETAGEF